MLFPGLNRQWLWQGETETNIEQTDSRIKLWQKGQAQADLSWPQATGRWWELQWGSREFQTNLLPYVCPIKMPWFQVDNVNHTYHMMQQLSLWKTEHVTLQMKKWDADYALLLLSHDHESSSSPRSRAMEAESIPRSRFKNVKADSHSVIILVTDEGSPELVSDNPTARAAYESRRFLKLPRNYIENETKENPLEAFFLMRC